MYDQQQQNNLLATKQKPCLASSSIVSFTKNSIHLMNDAYISETTTDVKLEKMELRISHHFSTLSEYPIISCCVKTIAVNQARGRRRSYKNNAQRGAAA